MISEEILTFFYRHKFDLNLSVETILQQVLFDMRLGLDREKKDGLKAGQDMFKTWILPPKEKPAGQSVIVIDAGGTNFRSCLVTFDGNGDFSISDFRKTKMPGVEKELSKVEFFDAIADNIEYLKDKSDRIGFCFSYAMSITKDGDGIPNAFSKEVKAPEVLGCPVGKNLVEVLEKKRGWKKISHISLLNDTQAALLAGKAAAKNGTEFSSYIGFILGTGINAAYVQPEFSDFKKQIVVCESGKCDKIQLSDFDVAMDVKTAVPKQYPLEKQCSGAYLGAVAFEMIRFAAEDGLFSEKCAKKVLELDKLSLIDVDEFLYSPCKDALVRNLCAEEKDAEIMYCLFEQLIVRCAKNAAAILGACAVQCGEGKSPVHPISMLCNGTTFYKTHKLRPLVESFLYDALTVRRGIYYEIVSVEDDITLGAAIAGCI